MTRAYFRTLPDLYERKAFGTETHPPYPPAAIACFLGVLCFGEQQPERGHFKSRRLLVVLLEGPHGEGKRIARQLDFLIEQGDLIEQASGALLIEGWDELQEGNWQVAERMSRYRTRTHGVTHPTVTTDTPLTVTPPSRVEAVSGKRLAEAVSGDGAVTPAPTASAYPSGDSDCLDTYHDLTLYRPWGQFSGDKLKGAITEYGDAVVDAALRAEHSGDPDRKTLLDRTLARLARDADRVREAKKAAPKAHRNGQTPEQLAAYEDTRRRLAAGEVL